MGFIFSNVSIIVHLGLKHIYYHVEVEYVSHNTMGIPPDKDSKF